MKRERKKRKRQQRNLNKEETLACELQIEKARLEKQRKICDYIARKYYDRWHSLLKREEASRKALTSIPRQSVTQRKVCTNNRLNLLRRNELSLNAVAQSCLHTYIPASVHSLKQEVNNASINSSGAHPPPHPPGNRGAFAHVVSPRGGVFAILSQPGAGH